MSVISAALNLVHRFPGGACALAPQLGKAAATLSHEVNPHRPDYKLGLRDAVTLSVIANDRGILNAFAAAMSCHAPVPMLVPPPDDAGMHALMERCGEVVREMADVVSTFQVRAADGDLSPNDVMAVQREVEEGIAALQAFSMALFSHLEADKAKAPR